MSFTTGDILSSSVAPIPSSSRCPNRPFQTPQAPLAGCTHKLQYPTPATQMRHCSFSPMYASYRHPPCPLVYATYLS